jgi:hypothetical protein
MSIGGLAVGAALLTRAPASAKVSTLARPAGESSFASFGESSFALFGESSFASFGESSFGESSFALICESSFASFGESSFASFGESSFGADHPIDNACTVCDGNLGGGAIIGGVCISPPALCLFSNQQIWTFKSTNLINKWLNFINKFEQ